MNHLTDTSRWQVTPESGLACWTTEPPQTDIDALGDSSFKKALGKTRKALADETDKLQASRSHSLLVIMQATDAAGKDSAVREVFSDVNVHAIRTVAFKRPTPIELRHDFLWRCATRLPARGEVVIFNRSYYEEVTTVRVHPEYLNYQYPGEHQTELHDLDSFWEQRFKAINAFEKHLTDSRTIVLKFWLNISADEQLNRFQRRLDKSDKRWKFNQADLNERPHWNAYQTAYHQALKATATEHAPWYAIPADSKDYARWQMAEIILSRLKQQQLQWPSADFDLEQARQELATHQ